MVQLIVQYHATRQTFVKESPQLQRRAVNDAGSIVYHINSYLYDQTLESIIEVFDLPNSSSHSCMSNRRVF